MVHLLTSFPSLWTMFMYSSLEQCRALWLAELLDICPGTLLSWMFLIPGTMGLATETEGFKNIYILYVWQTGGDSATESPLWKIREKVNLSAGSQILFVVECELTLELLMLRVGWRMRVLHETGRALRGIRAGHRAVLLGYEPGTRARLRLNEATTDTNTHKKKEIVSIH